MRSYDAICVFDPRKSEEEINKLVEDFSSRIKQGGGEIEKIDQWGLKKLTYTFQNAKKLTDGRYVQICFSAPANVSNSLRDIFRITDGLIRHIITLAVPKQPELEAPVEEEKVEISPEMLKSPSEEEK